jgi:hypothetical protein
MNVTNTLSTVVIIPYWIAHTLRRRNLPYTTILNFAEMAKHFSHQDLAILRAANMEKNLEFLALTQKSPAQLNDEENCCIGLDEGGTIGCGFSEWYDEIGMSEAEKEGFANTINSVSNLTYSDNTRQMLFERLYSEEGADAMFDTPYQMVDLGRKHIGVVIHPGYFMETMDSAVDRELQFLRQYDLVRAILLALYVQAPGFHLVASSPVFLRYLGLLSKKRMILA